MLVRSQNRRISYGRMSKASWHRIEEIVKTLTTEEVAAAEEEYRETRTTTNPRMSFLAQELSAFGQYQHMSNEERLYSRRQIKSLCIRHGMPCIWYTINPNDLTNEINMKLAAYRVAGGVAAEELVDEFRRQIGRIQHVVRDAVSSAKFFHREMELFFEHLVAVGEDSVFGKVSCYFGCVETNERGALHFHGLIWLEANMGLPTLFQDLSDPSQAGYAEQCCDVDKARRHRRWDSVFSNIKHLTSDLEKLDTNFDDDANWVAYRCQLHGCGAVCTKYSAKDAGNSNKAQGRTRMHPCRFKAPWKLYDRTEFTPDGLLRVRRNHERVNRYCPALAVAMRHNTDATFLPTNSAGLSMMFYATNYATKLETPLFKRMATVKMVLEGTAGREDERGAAAAEEDTDETTAQRNNRARQFLARTANQIFTSRELSAVEVCSSLLGYRNSYCSEENWVNVHLNSLYWAVFRRWDGLRQAAGPEVQLRAGPETVGFGIHGVKLYALDAYPHRGPLLKDLCFYEYLCTIRVQRVGHRSKAGDAHYVSFDDTLEDRHWWIQKILQARDQAVPVITGHLDNAVEETIEGFYKRSAVLLLALFIPWERFTYISDQLPPELWTSLKEDLPERVSAFVDNIQLLHKSAEDAKKDAKLWASRSEGDEGVEFDGAEEAPDPGASWKPGESDLRHTFHNVVTSLHDEAGVTRGSPGLGALLSTLDNSDFSAGVMDGGSADHDGTRQTQTTIVKRTLKAVKAAQDRLHRERMLAIEGDEPETDRRHTGAETGFGDDGADQGTCGNRGGGATARPDVDRHRARRHVHTRGSGRQCGKDVKPHAAHGTDAGVRGARRGCRRRREAAPAVHWGGGGTGKSWLIDSVKQVFAAKDVSNQLVITAMSGTAAAGIGAPPYTRPWGSRSVTPRARWSTHRGGQHGEGQGAMAEAERPCRRRGQHAGPVNALRGRPKAPDAERVPGGGVRGLPVVIFAGDFLQFTPVLQKSLLADIERIATGPDGTRPPPGGRAAERRWREAEAKKLWQGFTNVVILREQKRAQDDPYLLGFLERLRDGRQTREDAARLEARYKPNARLDFSEGRRAIIPLNRHRWDLTLHAAIAPAGVAIPGRAQVGVTGAHGRGEDGGNAAGDENGLAAAGIFPYIEGMPVVVNENRYMGLKVVNGAEYTATGVVHPPGLEEVVANEKVSIFLGPPSGILLENKETRGLTFPHLPPDTVLLPSVNNAMPELARPKFKLGLVRRGLPCTPGFALTDYKAQGRTLGKTLLGLYGRGMGRSGKDVERCDTVSLYVQLSRVRRFDDIDLIQPLNVEHFLEARMPEELVRGIGRLERLAEATVASFDERHGGNSVAPHERAAEEVDNAGEQGTQDASKPIMRPNAAFPHHAGRPPL
ncbi:hypothetical protein ColLi_12342 [Colletotrichum liriopes]|uniref:Helitron helicase-like domain-containing protein n=1 Tax=Colletotrichum liriopes TaxID=708192 RepID=A0AA37GY83_9PEZI|nr:hypothetical protein ColLi_12342 [Colletotrichum liriopes]